MSCPVWLIDPLYRMLLTALSCYIEATSGTRSDVDSTPQSGVISISSWCCCRCSWCCGRAAMVVVLLSAAASCWCFFCRSWCWRVSVEGTITSLVQTVHPTASKSLIALPANNVLCATVNPYLVTPKPTFQNLACLVRANPRMAAGWKRKSRVLC